MIYLGALIVLLIAVFSIFAVETKKVLNAIIFMSGASLFTTVAFVILRAPDVAMTEGAIGVGLTTFLFVATLLKLKNKGAINWKGYLQ